MKQIGGHSELLEREVRERASEHKARDTIFALATGAPPAAIAVIRVSGPAARAGLEGLVGDVPAPRFATLRAIRDPSSGEAIDHGLVLWFPGPASFTGEDTFELQLHGGHAVIAAMVAALGRLPGFRPAERGEFTRRAYVAGRMDLTEAEGLADLIGADTEGQRRAAIQQLGGSIRRQYESWATDLVRARAFLEAELDFSDEEGVSGAWVGQGRDILRRLAGEMEAALAGFEGARVMREGLEVMLLGPVNAGKSTLLNAIAGRDVAIVSEEAGTTRDLIEVTTELDGLKVRFVDGAGLREADGVVEREGVRRARERAEAADLVLWVSEGGAERPSEDVANGRTLWAVASKMDLDSAAGALIRERNEAWIPLSGKTGAGVAVLLDRIAGWARDRAGGEASVVTRERHRVAVVECLERLNRAGDAAELEVAAEELRLASRDIGRVTGQTDVEDVLDVVFSEFCIGK